MNTEVITALFSTTGIATVLGIGYQIWRERHGNEQKDMAGDLTLGELFRESAKRAVADIQTEADALRERLRAVEKRLADYKEQLDEEVEARRELEAKYRGAQDYVAVLVAAWREAMGVGHPLPEPPEEYFPASRKFYPHRGDV